MGMRSDEGGTSGYDIAALKRAQEMAAKLRTDLEGPPEEWLIGMDADEAEANLKHRGFRFRIAQRQGCWNFMMTADMVVTRYNVNVDADGKIIEVLGRG